MVTSRGDSSAGSGIESMVPARQRVGSSAFRKALRLAAITGVTGSAIFLFGVLGAQSANAATPDSTSTASHSSTAADDQQAGGLLGLLGNTLKGTVKGLGDTVGSILSPAPASSIIPATTPTSIPNAPASAPSGVATHTNTIAARTSSVPAPSVPAVAPVNGPAATTDDKPILTAVKPVLSGVSTVLSPVVSPVSEALRPVTSTTQPLVGGVVKALTGTVQGLTGALIPALEKLPVLGGILTPVINSLTPTLNGLLPELVTDVPLVKDLAGSLTPQTGGLIPAINPAITPPVSPPLFPAKPVRGEPLRALNDIVPAVAILPVSSSTPLIAQVVAIQTSSFTSVVDEIPASTEATGSTPQSPTAPRPTEPIAAPAVGPSSAGSGSGSAGSGGSAAATLSDIFAMPISVLSGTVGVPALILPEPLAYDPGSSPD